MSGRSRPCHIATFSGIPTVLFGFFQNASLAKGSLLVFHLGDRVITLRAVKRALIAVGLVGRDPRKPHLCSTLGALWSVDLTGIENGRR
jgi:hypothetical protein